MGQADDRHFGGHHRVGRGRDLLQRLQQHLPHAREHSHRHLFGHLHPARAFVGRDRGILGRVRGDLDHRHPMRDLGQVAQHRHRVGALGILRAQFRQRARRVAAQDHVHQVQHPAPVGQPQHGAHLIRRGFARAVADRLIQQRCRVPGRAFGGARDQRQRIVGDLRALGIGDPAQEPDHLFRLDPAQVESLTARQHRDRHLADFRCGKDELHMLGRLFQRLEQRVERAGGQHVNLVDDVDLVARAGRPIAHAVDDFADVAHAGPAGGVHLQHVHMAAFADRHAMFALPAGVCRGSAGAVGADAVHPLGDDPRGGRLAGAPDAGHDEGLRDPVGGKGIFQRAHHRILPDQVGECFGPVFAGKHLIGFRGGFGHLCSGGFVVARQPRARPRRRPALPGANPFGAGAMFG